MKRSALVLAGGLSKRFGKEDKCLYELGGKPLIGHVIDRVREVVNEVLIVTKRKKAPFYSVFNNCKIVCDEHEEQHPVFGLLAGVKKASGEFVAVLPCDTPFVSADFLELLFHLCERANAVVPRWPDGKIEPLQAVYRKRAVLPAIEEIIVSRRGIYTLPDAIRGVLYISVEAIRQFDGRLLTFMNINTKEDLRKAKRLLNEAQRSAEESRKR